MRVCEWCDPAQVWFGAKASPNSTIKGYYRFVIDLNGRFHYFHPQCHEDFEKAGCFECNKKDGELALVPVSSMYLIIHMRLVCKTCYDKITNGTPWDKVPRFVRTN